MTHGDDHHAPQHDLAGLQHDFPAYRIWREATGGRARLVAVRRAPGTSPHTLVTSDHAELRAALATATPGPGTPPPASHPAALEDYPQAIADDYPGWDVRQHDGQWTARCPAITVTAATAAGLRAAIEQAISNDGQQS